MEIIILLLGVLLTAVSSFQIQDQASLITPSDLAFTYPLIESSVSLSSLTLEWEPGWDQDRHASSVIQSRHWHWIGTSPHSTQLVQEPRL